MPGAVVDVPLASAQPGRLALIVPLALERQCLRHKSVSDAQEQIAVCQSGQGAQNAARAARAAVSQGATALMSIGVAGALSAGIDAGDVVIPDAVIDAATGQQLACSKAWSVAIRNQIAALDVAHAGTLLQVADVLATPAQKTRAAERFGCNVCDMESAAIAAVAQELGAHFAAIRVISDTSVDELPQNVSGWVDDSGNTRLGAVLEATMKPALWRSIISMARRFRLAQRRLRQVSEALAVTAYCCPQPGVN